MTQLIQMTPVEAVRIWGEQPGLLGGILAMAILVGASCALVGNYLVLRRISLVGDAISHSVLPGIAIAFLLSRSRDSLWMVLGALAAGMLTTILIEVIHQRSRVKRDAAIGITFSTLFAIGVILVSLLGDSIDLDLDCVLYGKLDFVADEPTVALFGIDVPRSVALMGVITVLTAGAIGLFYKELLVSSFDAGLAASLGLNPKFVHYALMACLSVIVVCSFEAVGSILVIAMLIIPPSTAYLLTDRLPWMIGLSVAHAVASALVGLHAALVFAIPTAVAVVLAGTVLFVGAWLFAPRQGLAARWNRRLELGAEGGFESGR